MKSIIHVLIRFTERKIINKVSLLYFYNVNKRSNVFVFQQQEFYVFYDHEI